MGKVISRPIDQLDLKVEIHEVGHPPSEDGAPGCENAACRSFPMTRSAAT